MSDADDIIGSRPDGPGAREAIAESLSEEYGVDLTPNFMMIVDKVLTRLALRGYIVAEFPNDHG